MMCMHRRLFREYACFTRRSSCVSFHTRVFASNGSFLGRPLATRLETFDAWSHSFASDGRIQGVGYVPLGFSDEKRITVRPMCF